MHDMLVKLYELEKFQDPEAPMADDILIRKPIGPEKHHIVEWVNKRFMAAWASEADMALCNRPATCFIALKGSELAGFACYDATARGYFGPMGVIDSLRHRGIGRALTLAALYDMQAVGYGYAIIGGVGPADFYKKTVGAVDIPGSSPGIWKTWLQ
jgi:GNAT superfamily N-acetyltransferase